MYKVLLVDDEEMVTQGLSRFVHWDEAGFEVAGTALSVSQALAQLENAAVDLVITDVQMPGQSGLDLIRILKEKYPQIKTIILSGYSDFAYAQQAVRLGALDYLTKPVNFRAMKELLLRVRDTLEKEKKHSGQDVRFQELLSHTLILNMANGLPFDEKRASVCLDVHCVIRAVRLTPRERTELPAEVMQMLVQAMQEVFAPCHVVSPTSSELLCVLEGHRDPEEVRWELDDLCARALPVCGGISDEVEGYVRLRTAAMQAGRAMRYQKARSSAGILLYDQVRQMFANSVETEDSTIRSLVEQFSNPEERPRLVHDFSAALSALETRSDFSLTRAQRFCTEFLVELDMPIQTLISSENSRHALLSETLMDVLGAQSVPELQAYMSHYLEQLFAELQQEDEAKHSGELIDQIKKYIQEHFAEELTLSVLSELFYVCPAYLSRLFKKKTGTKFVEYLTGLRMEKAKEFLADPGLMIYTVSEMVGYENPRYFSRLFKEAVGCTPQEYRSRLLGTPEPEEKEQPE